MDYPKIIQGGMGVAISSWELANAVSQTGQLGVVSGTGISLVLIGRLNNGDKSGNVRRALAHFPDQAAAQRILDKYFVEVGITSDKAYQRPPMWTMNPSPHLEELTVIANFVEVWLAKEGHSNPVGINLLEKVQMPNMASLYGAMLAGVDYVIMGAGIPMQIPGILDKLATHQAVSYRLDVHGADENAEINLHFDPQALFSNIDAPLTRPQFLPIVSSVVLALALRKRATGEINGFVIEMPTAGGHNAPPRGAMKLDDNGEPIYGKKDDVKLSKFRDLGLPFWLAGGYGSPEKLQEALDEGAQGVQVGTAFAYCDESGMVPEVRQQVIADVLEEEITVFTDPRISPTGFPFKVIPVSNTIVDDTVYEERDRICDIGYLRTLYMREDGKVGYRCPAEPVNAYVKKGGKVEETEGRKCLCNHLGASAGYAQVRKGSYVEPALVTSGDDVVNIGQFLPEGATTFTAADVITHILGK